MTLRPVNNPAAGVAQGTRNVKVTKDMLNLAKHIVNQKAGRFEPEKFEDQYEAALVDLINKKRAGQPITKKDRPAGGNVVDLMEALRRSVGARGPAKASKSAKKPRKAAFRPEGNADTDRRQEVGKGSDREEDLVEAATQVGLGQPSSNGAKGVLNDQGQAGRLRRPSSRHWQCSPAWGRRRMPRGAAARRPVSRPGSESSPRRPGQRE
jgi:hypothetical protein